MSITTRSGHLFLQLLTGSMLTLAMAAAAQAPATPPAAAAPATPAAAPAPLTTPAVTGPLAWLPPANFDAGPLGKLSVNGIVTGYGRWQDNPVPGDSAGNAALSNGQIFIQKADGKVQYFIEAGAYTMPSIGAPFLSASQTVSDFFGPVPVAFLKLQAGKYNPVHGGRTSHSDGRGVHLHL